jgi:hypothetical protein
MPTYRNITLNLQSDTTDTIIELAPPSSHVVTPAKPSHHHHGSAHPPQLRDDTRAIISVYVPILPKSLFWLNYHITPPPLEPGHFYVFKMFVNRTEVVTWSCSEEQKFRGKCMFGLYDTGLGDDGVSKGYGVGMQKRAFRWGDSEVRVTGDLSGDPERDRFVEVRVCRANKMVRIQPEYGMAPNMRDGPGFAE